MFRILTIEPYVISDNGLCELSNKIKNYTSESFFTRLPEYSIRVDNGKIDYTQYYHQFGGLLEVDESENKEMYFLNLKSNDNILNEEISNSGVIDLFSHIDFRIIFDKLNKENLIHDYNKLIDKFILIENIHLVFDLVYEGEYEDCEVKIDLIGYLDDKLKLIKI